MAKPESKPTQPATTEPPTLGALEQRVLQLLAHADGRYVNFQNAADHLHVSRLLLERACEILGHRGLIEPHRDILHGAQIALTREGRDFVIEQGFLLGRERVR